MSVPFCTSDLPLTQSSHPFSDEVQSACRGRLLELADYLPILPSPKGCDKHGQKVEFTQELDHIARRMCTARPKSREWFIGTDLPAGHVLKREYSDAGRHVYIPHQPSSTETDIAAEKKRVQRFLAKTREDEELENFRWLAQEHVPTLAAVGELRFMCIDGEPVRVVITGKHQPGHREAGKIWCMEGIATMLSLNDLRYAPSNRHVRKPS